MKFPLSILAILAMVCICSAQKAKVKFGKVPIQDLEMEVYAPDSTAEAVILYNQGFFNSEDLRFYRHLRVKILKKSGLDWGNWTFSIPSKSAIKGVVHNLDHGDVIKEKLKISDIREEEITSNYRVYKVYMPNVKVGSVIEIAYNFQGIPFEWRFQDRIPVVYSELKMEKTQYINFSFNTFGFEPIKTIAIGRHWVAENVPSISIEPHMNDYKNFLTKFEFEVKSINIPGRYYDDFTTSWQDVNKELIDARYCGGILDESAYLNAFAKNIKALGLSDLQKVDTAYQYVMANMAWNGRSSIYATTHIRDNFRNEHKGNCAEINLSLVSLLRKVGIEAHPVALSTRRNGMLNPLVPSLRKLNYLIAYARIDDQEILMDATAKGMPPGYLPKRVLNGQGRLISEGATKWVSLTSKGKDKIQSMVKMEVEPDNYTCTVQNKYSSYAFIDWNAEYNGYDTQEGYKTTKEEELSGIEINGIEVSQQVNSLSGSERIEADLTNMVDDFGGEVMIRPLFALDFQHNPFANPERKFPVDFIIAKSRQAVVTVNVSDDFEIISVPEPIQLQLSDKSASLKFFSSINGQVIQIQALIDIKRTNYTETEYAELRSYYSMVIDKVTDGIVLQKRT